jgi:hypothetical protein
MSGRNGDKARFNTNRRRKLAKRQRVWAFFAADQARPKPPVVAAQKRVAPPVAAAPAPVAAPPAEPKLKRATSAGSVAQAAPGGTMQNAAGKTAEKKGRAKPGTTAKAGGKT